MKKSAVMFVLAVFCCETLSAKDTHEDPAGPSGRSSIVKPGPDTEPGKTYRRAKYITAFSQFRGAGAEGNDQPGVLGMMPSVGELEIDPDAYRSAFDHQDSTLEPGCFSVKLKDNDVQVDMTATDHVVVYRFTFPESKESHVVVDVSHMLKMFRGGDVRLRDDKTIEGTAKYDLGRGEEIDIAFSFQFSKPSLALSPQSQQ